MFTYHQDTQEEIQKCLHCTYKECIDCLGPKGSERERGKTARKHAEWTAEIRALARLGYSDRQIARSLGISAKTVLTLRQAAGIPTQRAYCYDRRKSYV